MSDIQHINVDDEEFEGAPKALRDHVKKLQRALGERDTEVSTLRGQLNSKALSDVLGGFKNPKRVESAILADKVDPLDSEAVKSWLAENSDDYAKADGAQAPAQEPSPADAQQQAQAQQYAALSAGGELTPAAEADKQQKLAAEAAKISTERPLSFAEMAEIAKRLGA